MLLFLPFYIKVQEIIAREKIYKYKKTFINKCYNSNFKIIHFIITRFLLYFYSQNGFPKLLHEKDYILNGILVMRKYLFPSLENQSCKKFTWILMLGDKANITYIKSLFNFKNSFEKKIIYQKNIKNFVNNVTKGYDVLITTRIDYDDVIYYDAVNDVRKAINRNKPMILYGYNSGQVLKHSEIPSTFKLYIVPFGTVISILELPFIQN